MRAFASFVVPVVTILHSAVSGNYITGIKAKQDHGAVYYPFEPDTTFKMQSPIFGWRPFEATNGGVSYTKGEPPPTPATSSHGFRSNDTTRYAERDLAAVTIADIERIASTKLEPGVGWYYNGGADQEETIKENKEAFRRLRFRPRMLVDVSWVSTATTLLGQPVSMPFGFSPSAMQQLAHPDGEIGAAQAAEAAGTLMILSSMSTISLEDIRLRAPNCTLWLQVYVYKDRALTESLVKRAAAAGFSAVVLTADSPVFGQKVMANKYRFHLPKHLRFGTLERSLPSATAESHADFDEFVDDLISPSVTWSDVAWLREVSGLPVVVKGVLSPEAAVQCYESGAAAIIVSNHGGRQLDGTPATIDVLPEIVDAVGGRLEVYLDSGVRTGADVVRALALGARAAFVGRPVLWGLAYNGKKGVSTVLDIYRSELERTLRLLGCVDVTELTPEFVVHKNYFWSPHCRQRRRFPSQREVHTNDWPEWTALQRADDHKTSLQQQSHKRRIMNPSRENSQFKTY
ncbi:uncharacterized protein LOC119179425 [Rhipicephalus microplus]|uniref:uncharacterized protein LOC119179425 n=1 Tax=Rhipicephalus microplus TaxID=6941 RepID=UPI003F6AA062